MHNINTVYCSKINKLRQQCRRGVSFSASC